MVISDLVIVKKNDARESFHQWIGKYGGANCNSVHDCVCKLQPFLISTCILFLLYKSIFLLLQLCRVVTLRKLLPYMQDSNFTKAYQEFQKQDLVTYNLVYICTVLYLYDVT